MTPERRKTAQRGLRAWVLVLLALAALAAAWIWTPLGALVEPRGLADRFAALGGHPLAPLVVVGGFLVAGLLALPITPMVVLTVSAFTPVAGFFHALLGVTVLAVVAFGVGRLAGHRHVRRLTGSRIHRVSQRLGDAGVIAVTALRLVPIAHFTLASLAAGASHIRWRDFVVGTILGMVPGIAAISFLLDRASSAVRDPAPARLAALALASLAILAVLWVLRAWLHRR